MTNTPKLDALIAAVSANPPRWRMRRAVQPIFNILDNVPDDRGGEWFELTETKLINLLAVVGRLAHGTPGFEWLRKDGRNVFDSPLEIAIPSVMGMLTAGLSSEAQAMFDPKKLMPLQISNGFFLALWTARQHGIIGSGSWSHYLLLAWNYQKPSLHMTVDLDRNETAKMFDLMSDFTRFFLGGDIKCRADIPETIVLHRGIGADEVQADDAGYSWTQNLQVAQRFAWDRRNHGAPKVVTATFSRNDVVAVIHHPKGLPEWGREEFSEWLIHPEAKPVAASLQAMRWSPLFGYELRPCTDSVKEPE